MDGNPGRVSLCKAHGAEIAHDERIDARLRKRLEVGGQRCDVVGRHRRIERHVHLYARRMRKRDRVRHGSQCEVRSALAQAEPITGEIHRIGPEMDGVFELVDAPRRGKQLGLFPRRRHERPLTAQV